ncbi:fimbria/pilus periplasmic chaperone [Citrobacter braakii]|uniref:fimbria/pilus periplasmic chaperone n=1 Tax=Citrobacter braakii TaxID=57706 RepID=UPI00351D5ECB
MSELPVLKGRLIAFSLFCLGVQVIPVNVYANNTEVTTQPFTVKVGVSRVIYGLTSGGESISVSNLQDYPMLIQSTVLGEDRKTRAPFVVTPPLFRLDGQQQSRLNIVRTGGDFAKDRESLQWLCIKGIPPKADDAWAKGKDGKPAASEKVSINVRVSVSSCIKLLVRPDSVKSAQGDDERLALSWRREGNKLKATNSSPRYISLSSLKVGGVAVKGVNYISPFSSSDFLLLGEGGKESDKKVYWTVINDYGGESQVYQADIK